MTTSMVLGGKPLSRSDNARDVISYRGNPVRDFLEPLARTLPTPLKVTLAGPLPLCVVGRRLGLKRVGWSALILAKEGRRNRPIAVVDAGRSRQGVPFHSVHNADVAKALHDAIVALRARTKAPAEALRVAHTEQWRDMCVIAPKRSKLVAPVEGYPAEKRRAHRSPIFSTLQDWYRSMTVKRSRRSQHIAEKK